MKICHWQNNHLLILIIFCHVFVLITLLNSFCSPSQCVTSVAGHDRRIHLNPVSRYLTSSNKDFLGLVHDPDPGQSRALDHDQTEDNTLFILLSHIHFYSNLPTNQEIRLVFYVSNETRTVQQTFFLEESTPLLCCHFRPTYE